MSLISLISFTGFARTVLGLRLTEGQRVYSRVAFDGVDPEDLEGRDQEVALQIFGGIGRIPKDSRRQLVLRFGRTSGKSLLCAAYGIYRMMTADLSSCGPGDRVAVVVVSFRLEEAGIILGVAKELVQKSPQLKKSIVQVKADRFVLKRWDGRRVTFKTAPKSAGGASVRGFSIILAIMDESEFVGTNKTGAVITDKNIIDAAMPRVMPGGALVLASTPWPAVSETSKLFDTNYSRPKVALCALAPTLSIRGDDPEVVARVAFERARDPRNALREYDCIVSDAEGLFYEQSSVEGAARPQVVAQLHKGTAGIDLAFKGDSSALCIIERQGEKIVVVYLDIVNPKPDRPLVPSEVMRRFSESARRMGCREFAADGHYIETAREVAHQNGLQVVSGPRGPQVVKTHMYVRALLREGKLILPPDQRLLGQLKSVQSQALPGGGLSVVLPRGQGAGHCDLVSALLAAVWHDRRYGLLTDTDMKEPIKGPPVQSGSPFVGASSGYQKW